MTTDKNLLAAIKELIETLDGNQEWESVVGKLPELASAEAIAAMEEIIEAFDEDTLDDIIQHWKDRVAFLKNRQAPPV